MLAHAFSTEYADKEANIHSLDTLILELSKLTLLQIYSIQHATATDIILQDNAVAY